MRQPPSVRNAAGVIVVATVVVTVGAGALISLIDSDATGPGGAPHSSSQLRSCAPEAAYTILPRPIQPWLAEHIGQCSPEV